MIAALFALAAAMIIGGAAAVIQGFPYVRLESGLAMVIAGSVAASSGAVLIGLGVVALALRRVERAARSVAASAAAPLAAPPADAPAEMPSLPAEGRPRLPPVLPPAPAFVLPVADTQGETGRARIEPTLRHEPDAPTAPVSTEPELPMPGLTPPSPDPEPAAAPEEPRPAAVRGTIPEDGSAPEDDLFAVPEAPPEPHGRDTPAAEEVPILRPSLDAADAPEPAPKPERTVVGRHASGGNTYMMFDDGSIEADTPNGRFTFASLDELKAFVDGGGEAGARGAA